MSPSSLRRSQPHLQIYRDPDYFASASNFTPHVIATTTTTTSITTLAQQKNTQKLTQSHRLQEVPSKKNPIFNPPAQNVLAKKSPQKTSHLLSSTTPPRIPLSNKLNMVSIPPPGTSNYTTDSIMKKQPLMSKFKPQKSLFPYTPCQATLDADTAGSVSHDVFGSAGNDNDGDDYDDTGDIDDDDGTSCRGQKITNKEDLKNENLNWDILNLQRKLTSKRLLDAAPIHDSRPLKKIKARQKNVGKIQMAEDGGKEDNSNNADYDHGDDDEHDDNSYNNNNNNNNVAVDDDDDDVNDDDNNNNVYNNNTNNNTYDNNSNDIKREKRGSSGAGLDGSWEESEAEKCLELPAPSSFPPLHDDGTKPPHSYAQLIGMSILRAPNRRLTLAQIYKWISDTFTFYSPTDAGWQNSIRHNLSLNKAFIKQERPKDDPGKGNYWIIQPGMESQFIKEKESGRKYTISLSEHLPSLPPPPTPIDGLGASYGSGHQIGLNGPYISVVSTQSRGSITESTAFGPDISSDATIPNSDLNTDPEFKENETPPPQNLPPHFHHHHHHHHQTLPLIESSSPTPLMHSSPPISYQISKGTPPAGSHVRSSLSRDRCNQSTSNSSLDDSGYFSSLDSSVLRGGGGESNCLALQDIDPHGIPRGRAEEEIARLRGSLCESPSKVRQTLFPISSSPSINRGFMAAEFTPMLPPLTPAVKLTAPNANRPPPPSASPNTNLRLHRDRVREMVGSPLRGMTTLDESFTWSTAATFSPDESGFMFSSVHDLNADLDIFNIFSTQN